MEWNLYDKMRNYNHGMKLLWIKQQAVIDHQLAICYISYCLDWNIFVSFAGCIEWKVYKIAFDTTSIFTSMKLTNDSGRSYSIL